MATTTTQLLAEHWQQEGANGSAHELALAPLVDKIAYGLARGLVVAMKELENHIASETRKVSDSVGRRLDALQASFQDLSGVVSEQRTQTVAVQERCTALEAATAALDTKTDQLATSVTQRIDGLGK